MNPPSISHPIVDHQLAAVRAGDVKAFRELFVSVYAELKRAAQSVRRRMNVSETLSTTALVHESFLKLGRVNSGDITDPEHAVRLASCAMREIVIDHLRARMANKRERQDVELEQADWSSEALASGQESVALELAEAVVKLEQQQARLAQVVNLRFFAGLSEEEIGDLLGVDARTVRRDWVKAKAWLAQALGWHAQH